MLPGLLVLARWNSFKPYKLSLPFLQVHWQQRIVQAILTNGWFFNRFDWLGAGGCALPLQYDAKKTDWFTFWKNWFISTRLRTFQSSERMRRDEKTAGKTGTLKKGKQVVLGATVQINSEKAQAKRWILGWKSGGEGSRTPLSWVVIFLIFSLYALRMHKFAGSFGKCWFLPCISGLWTVFACPCCYHGDNDNHLWSWTSKLLSFENDFRY